MDIDKGINDFKEFKDYMIKILNLHPLISFKIFKKITTNYIYNNTVNLELKSNTLKIIYYPWKHNAKIFSLYSIFDNNLTNNNKQYLRDVSFTLLWDEKGTKLYYHSYNMDKPLFYKNNNKFSIYIY